MANWYCNSPLCDWSGELNPVDLCPKCRVANCSPRVIRCPINGEKLHPKALVAAFPRRFMIEGRKTGFQPVPGVTWPADRAKQALAEFRSMLRYRHHDLQLIEVPETAR